MPFPQMFPTTTGGMQPVRVSVNAASSEASVIFVFLMACKCILTGRRMEVPTQVYPRPFAPFAELSR